MTVENATPIAEIIEVVETPEERTQREEKERSKRRSALQRQIEERQQFIVALLERLTISTKSKEERGLIMEILSAEFLAVLDLLPEYQSVGGTMYGVDRGMWRKYFTCDD